jgi:hypothetical protein
MRMIVHPALLVSRRSILPTGNLATLVLIGARPVATTRHARCPEGTEK